MTGSKELFNWVRDAELKDVPRRLQYLRLPRTLKALMECSPRATPENMN